MCENNEQSNIASELTTKQANTLIHTKTVYIRLLWKMKGWKVHCKEEIQYQWWT